MATWKKVIVSGSNISQLNNDAGYLTNATLPSNVNSFATMSINGVSVTADSSVDTLTFASSSGAGLNIVGDAGNDSITFNLTGIPTTSLLASGSTIGSTVVNLGTTVTTLAGLTSVTSTGFTGSLLGTAATASNITPAIQATGNNRVLTDDGDGTVTAEANLTFDGSTLILTGAGRVSGDFTVSGSTILGDASGDAVTVNAATVKIANVGAGSTDTVVIRDASNNLATRAIDTRVWGTTLIDASGTPVANQVPYFTDANTVVGVAGFTYTPGTSLFTAPNVLITGDITVQGTASFQQTTNLQVADRFVLLASGSNSTTDGGIVVQQANLNIGELFGWDAGTDRWALTGSFTANQSAFTPDAFMSAVVTATATNPNTTAPPARYAKNGNIYICTTGGDEGIWIYS